MDPTFRGKAEVTKAGEIVGTFRYVVHIDARGQVSGDVQDVRRLEKPTGGPRILKWPRVSTDLIASGPQDPKLLMVLENRTRVEFWVVSTDGEISNGRIVEDETNA